MKRLYILMLVVFCSATEVMSQQEGSVDLTQPVLAYQAGRNDTVRALTNLYSRKRKGGTARAVVFGLLDVASIAGTASYKPGTVTVNQGSAGSQTFTTSSDSPPAINYVFIGFCTVMTITGITQASKYSDEKLQVVLDDYKQSGKVPPDILSKLKQKDFN